MALTHEAKRDRLAVLLRQAGCPASQCREIADRLIAAGETLDGSPPVLGGPYGRRCGDRREHRRHLHSIATEVTYLCDGRAEA